MGQIKVTKCPIEGLYIIEPHMVTIVVILWKHIIRMICTKQVLIWCLYRTTKV